MGEFRCCCSCSYSLMSLFFNGCALFDVADVVGETEDETGELIVGGVFPVVMVNVGPCGGLLKFGDCSRFCVNVGSC